MSHRKENPEPALSSEALIGLPDRAMDSELRIVRIDTLEGLEPYAESWDQLVLRRPQPLPMLSHAWVASYFEHQLLPGETWFCLLAFDSSELVGVLPVIAAPQSNPGKGHQRFRAPSNKHTVSVDFVVEPRRCGQIIPLFLSYICSLRPRFCCLELKRLPESSPSFAALSDGLRGIIAAQEFDGYGSYIKIEGGIDDYRTVLGARFTRNLRRLGRKLQTLSDFRVIFLNDERATEEHLQRFMELEATGWKSRKGTAIVQTPSLVSFYKALIRRLSRRGWMEWHFLEADGKTLAGHLAVHVNGTLVIFKIAYDEAYASYSPGTILFQQMIERAFSSKEINEIDCLSDYPWNAQWCMVRRTYRNLYIFNQEPYSLLSGVLPMKLRALARTAPGLRQIYRLLADHIGNSND